MKRLGMLCLVSMAACGHSAAHIVDTAHEDQVTDDGHVFVCEARAGSDGEALDAAQAACSDKICRVCGVEVESTFIATESLKGVDVKRTIVERCQRVRSGGLTIKRKSSDCGNDGCTTRITVLFSKADERAECKSYTDGNFTDPSACEADIEAFRRVSGQTSASMLERRGHLQSALIHCAKIDVRPTPLIMALNEKLLAGMDAFEFTPERQEALVRRGEARDREMRGFLARVDAGERDRGTIGGREDAVRSQQQWDHSREEILRQDTELVDRWLVTYAPLRAQIAETKILTDRIRLVLDYVINKQYVLAVIEAGGAPLIAPGGVKTLFEAMKQAPRGQQYGAENIHFWALDEIAWRATASNPKLKLTEDYSFVMKWMDETYPNAEEWKRYNFFE